MRELKTEKTFEKDLKRERRGQFSKTIDKDVGSVIELLRNDEKLPRKYKDHALIGEYRNMRECHIKNDFLLIYHKDDANNALVLSRLGSHARVLKL